MQKTLFENENMIEPLKPAFCIGAVSRSTLLFGDCLIESDKIESGSVDLILTDLPYGNMKGLNYKVFNNPSKDNGGLIWDNTIDANKIMQIANRILRKNGKMLLFAQQPFTTELINAQIPNLPHSYNLIWEKTDFANCLLINKACANFYEDILIFSKNHQKHDFEGMHPLRPYFKVIMDFIGLNLKQINNKLGHRRAEHTFYIDSTQYGLCTEKTYLELIEVFEIDKIQGFKPFAELKQIDTEYRTELLKQMNDQYPSTFNLWEGNKYKSNILKYKKDYNGYHPTQKPVLLLEDLIKTFSNENDLVVDLTMGSGSTGVACKNTNRNFIGIEKDENYYNIAVRRVSEYCG
jgi:site-specific DNA-methyltransferase (adenine-specific)